MLRRILNFWTALLQEILCTRLKAAPCSRKVYYNYLVLIKYLICYWRLHRTVKALLGDTENWYFCADSLMFQNKSTSPEIAWALTLPSCLSVVTNTAYIKVKFDAANELSNVSQSCFVLTTSQATVHGKTVETEKIRARPSDSLVGFDTL
jgi:hypothetical protein